MYRLFHEFLKKHKTTKHKNIHLDTIRVQWASGGDDIRLETNGNRERERKEGTVGAKGAPRIKLKRRRRILEWGGI